MKTIIKTRFIKGLLLTFVAISGACAKETTDPEILAYANIIDVGWDGTTLFNSNLESALSADLSFSDAELEILQHMKEEEKLARDVYTALLEKWKIPVFKNISAAESNHLNAVLYLLKDYGDEYTAVEEPGKFSIPEFQDLYNELTTKGTGSIGEAVKAGALIEERDIKDLAESIEKVTDESIKMVFENLVKGSRNHLRAFNRQLVRLGVEYTPQYLTQEEYDQIISSPHERGSVYPCWRNPVTP